MKKASVIFIFVLIVFSAFASAQTDIHKVDFKNFTYPAFCVDENPVEITVKNGEFLDKSEDNYFHFWVKSVNYGDLNGDGIDEAVIITVCHPGGTGKFSEGYIFGLKNKQPVLVARIAGGDRAAGGLVSAQIENQTLIIESNEEGSGGLCCPDFVVTNKFRLDENKLVDFGKPTKRELYPAHRVSFPKGSFSLTFDSEIEYKKRFVVTARKGQTLYVKINQQNSPIYLMKGTADIIQTEDGLTAKLKADGDFVFQVNNNNEGKLIYTITVEIK